MLRSAPPKIKHGARSCLGLGDVFLIQKEADSASVTKYKNIAILEKARADENAEEIMVLRDMLNGFQGGDVELENLRQALADREGKLKDEESKRASAQAAAQAAIEDALQQAANLRALLAKAEEEFERAGRELEAEKKRSDLLKKQLEEERASKKAASAGGDEAAAMLAKLQAELAKLQAELNEERIKSKAKDNEIAQLKEKLKKEEDARKALEELAGKQKKFADGLQEKLDAANAEIARLKKELADLQKKAAGLQEKLDAANAEIARLRKELGDEKSARGAVATDGMAAAAAVAKLQKELDSAKADLMKLKAELAGEKAAHLATDEARKVALVELAKLKLLLEQKLEADPRAKAAEAQKRVEDLLKKYRILFDGAGAKATQQSPKGVPQAWNLDSLDANKRANNKETLGMLAAILKDYPELYCELRGTTDADPSKPPDSVLADYFKLNETKPIQDKLAENRALACRAGLVERGVPGDQLVVTFRGCGGSSKVDFIPCIAEDALGKVRGKVYEMRENRNKIAIELSAATGELKVVSDERNALAEELARLKAELARLQALLDAKPDIVDPNAKLEEARKRVEDVLRTMKILFDGAGNKATQQSALGVPQAWNIDSLDKKKKDDNNKILDMLAAILKDYPDLYCVLFGTTDADPSKKPDDTLAEFFGLNKTQLIQDKLAEGRAEACKEGLVKRGVPAGQLVVTYAGCGGSSKVDFVPVVAAEAIEKVRSKLYLQFQEKDRLMAEYEAEIARLQALLAAKPDVVDPNAKAKEALGRIQELLKQLGWIQFDGAGNRATQQSSLGVAQAWALNSLDRGKRDSNEKIMDMLAQILKDYPDLYCELRGTTDADPSKPPDSVLADYFKLNETKPIQDRLAENRALACKRGLVNRGVPGDQLVVTFRGCGGSSKVDFIPCIAEEAINKVRGKLYALKQKTQGDLSGLELEALKARIAELEAMLEAMRLELAAANAATGEQNEKRCDCEEQLEALRASLMSQPTSPVRAPQPVSGSNDFGVLRVTLFSATGLKAANKDGTTSDPFTKVYLGDVMHKSSHIDKTLDPTWNEKFEFHGTLGEIVASSLETHVYDSDLLGVFGSQAELGKAIFDLPGVEQNDLMLESPLSLQGNISLKASWAPARIIKSGPLYQKHRGDIVANMGKYVKHQFFVWYAEHKADGGWTDWKCWRLAYKDRMEIEHYGTVIGLADQVQAKYEFSVITLEHGKWAMRCDSGKEYKEWITLLGKVEDPDLVYTRRESIKPGRRGSLRRGSQKAEGDSPGRKQSVTAK